MCGAAQIIGYGIVSIQVVTGAEVCEPGGGLDSFTPQNLRELLLPNADSPIISPAVFLLSAGLGPAPSGTVRRFNARRGRFTRLERKPGQLLSVY